MTKGYTIAEAAEVLNLSTKTIRRRIHKGELPATLEDGPYGDQYIIPAVAIDTAQEIVDVVKVNRPTDATTLALVITQALDERDRQLVMELKQTLDEEREVTRKPWWKRLLGLD